MAYPKLPPMNAPVAAAGSPPRNSGAPCFQMRANIAGISPKYITTTDKPASR